MFKKVIGQDNREPARPAPKPPESRSPEPLAAPAAAPQQAYAAPSGSPVATRNVLSTDVEIKGTLKFTNDLIVDGKIEGEVSSSGNLTIGENARIKAEVKTATIIIYGKVHGNLSATDRIELKASAEVIGDIKTKTLLIEAGAIFVGKSTVGTPTQAVGQSSAPQQSQKPAAKPQNNPSAPKQGSPSLKL